jgi:hypothetical protein
MNTRTKYLLSGVAAGAGGVAPAGALATLPAVPLSWPVLTAIVAVTGGGGGAYALHVLAHHPDIDPVQGRKRWATALAFPFVYGLGAAVALAGVAPRVGVWGPLALGAAVYLPGGTGIALTARAVHADRAVAEGELLAEVEPAVPARRDNWFFRYQRHVAVVAAVALLGTAAWLYRTGGDDAWFLLLMGGFAAIQALPEPDQRLVLYDLGFRSGNRVTRWEDCEVFELTADELVVHGKPWQLVPLRIDRDDLEDEQRVLSVLADHLERRDRPA